MSEIFDWFKRKETEKRPELLQISSPAVEVLHYEPDGKGNGSGNGATSESVPVKVGIHSAAKFDLSLADYRIKSVLDPVSMVGEQFRILRAKLGLMQKQRGIRTLLVTSATPEEGKTFSACSLAGVLAQEPGRRVLLIDADMRKPKASREVGLAADEECRGLSDVLRGEIAASDALLSSLETDLFLLPAGKVPPNPSELLSSPTLEQALRSLSGMFDWLVIDSPPVLPLADATMIAPLCDAVLMVVHASATPSKLSKEAICRIGKEKICGIILNRVKHIQSSRYYYHYYQKASS